MSGHEGWRGPAREAPWYRQSLSSRKAIPSIAKFSKEYPNEIAALHFLTTEGVILRIKDEKCSGCGGNMGLKGGRGSAPKQLKCNRKGCGGRVKRAPRKLIEYNCD